VEDVTHSVQSYRRDFVYYLTIKAENDLGNLSSHVSVPTRYKGTRQNCVAQHVPCPMDICCQIINVVVVVVVMDVVLVAAVDFSFSLHCDSYWMLS